MTSYPPISFANIRLVTEDMLANRLVTVKTLAETENEAYMIEKDSETGEHYLHYAVRHLNVVAGGSEEAYHHLLPLEHDDVISLALGAPDFAYPDHWRRPYLRNGPSGGFVWYDPEGATAEGDRYAGIADEIRAKLQAFRQAGREGEAEVRLLMEELDRLFDATKPIAKPTDLGPLPD